MAKAKPIPDGYHAVTPYLSIKGAADACTDLTCSEQTLVVADDGARAGLATLNAGDIVRLEGPGGRPERIVVVRRVWDELSSPER